METQKRKRGRPSRASKLAELNLREEQVTRTTDEVKGKPLDNTDQVVQVLKAIIKPGETLSSADISITRESLQEEPVGRGLGRRPTDKNMFDPEVGISAEEYEAMPSIRLETKPSNTSADKNHGLTILLIVMALAVVLLGGLVLSVLT